MKDIEVCFVAVGEELYEYFFEYSRERELNSLFVSSCQFL